MSKLTLEQLRSAFKTRESEGGGQPNNYYPFWNMKVGESCTIRFLPDANQENPLGFLVEKLMHNLEINGERKSVPCLSMYDEECPVCKVSRAYYKAEDKKNGGKYWKKKQFITQAIVVEDPLPVPQDAETHEGKIRFIALGSQVYNVIKEAFESGELDELPFAYEGGTDFIIKKSQQGDYPSYSIGTKFARRSTDLDDDTIANIDLIDLATLLPKHPGLERVEAMLEADLTGGEYEDKSSGNGNDNAKQSKPASKAPAKKVVEEDKDEDDDDVPFSGSTKVKESAVEKDADDDVDGDVDDILAQIRKRQSSKNE